MTNDADHKFKPGTEVALINFRYDRRITKRVVEKVFKNGNFTLVGETPAGAKPQQWRQNGTPVTDGHIRAHVEVWAAKHDQEIIDQRLLAERRRLKDELEKLVQAVNVNDPRMTDRLQVALAALRGPEEQS